jgi:hypothetical protein
VAAFHECHGEVGEVPPPLSPRAPPAISRSERSAHRLGEPLGAHPRRIPNHEVEATAPLELWGKRRRDGEGSRTLPALDASPFATHGRAGLAQRRKLTTVLTLQAHRLAKEIRGSATCEQLRNALLEDDFTSGERRDDRSMFQSAEIVELGALVPAIR